MFCRGLIFDIFLFNVFVKEVKKESFMGWRIIWWGVCKYNCFDDRKCMFDLMVLVRVVFLMLLFLIF